MEKKNKFDETKDKRIIFVLGVCKDGEEEFAYDFGVFPTAEIARVEISKRGTPNDEYRIFVCNFLDRIKLKTKIEHVEEKDGKKK